MNFTSFEDCRIRAADLGVVFTRADRGKADLPSGTSIRFSVEEAPYAAIALARKFASWLGDFTDCELCVTEFGIWPSREDLNLYRRLRLSYGDQQHLADAPGHLFNASEPDDLSTFLAIAIQFGWGGYVVPKPCAVSMFLSHDGWISVASHHGSQKIEADLNVLEIEYEAVRNAQ
jgi:hypothetical protein